MILNIKDKYETFEIERKNFINLPLPFEQEIEQETFQINEEWITWIRI